MRVLQLISSSGLYGAETVVLNLSEELERMGSRSVVGVFRNSAKSAPEIASLAAARGLQVEAVRCDGRVDLNAVMRIREIVSREQIDVVHSHGYKSHLYAYSACRNLCPMVATSHGHYSRRSANGVPSLSDLKFHTYRSLERNVLHRFDRVVCVSKEMSDELRRAGLSASSVTVIANGVDMEAYCDAAPAADLQYPKSGRVAIGIVSRLIERKGHRELFRAAREILVRCPNTVYVVIGDGPLQPDLEELAGEYGIASSVIFTGKRSDMANVYSVLDILALPSHAEGLPMAVIEAMAAGKPVVASNVGAIPELIRDGKTGILIEPGNHSSLQEGIVRLLNDPMLRRDLGQNAQELVRKQFSLAAMGRKYYAEYQRATDRNLATVAAAV
jgi:glycosyltransferase involved in cell wall biosynthesis